MHTSISSLVPLAHVADVERSVRFYERLGFILQSKFPTEPVVWRWASMTSGSAEIMFATGDSAVSTTEQGILFYLYTQDLVGLRAQLLAKGVAVSEIEHPFYMPGGEISVDDPDGYTLLIAQI